VLTVIVIALVALVVQYVDVPGQTMVEVPQIQNIHTTVEVVSQKVDAIVDVAHQSFEVFFTRVAGRPGSRARFPWFGKAYSISLFSRPGQGCRLGNGPSRSWLAWCWGLDLQPGAFVADLLRALGVLTVFVIALVALVVQHVDVPGQTMVEVPQIKNIHITVEVPQIQGVKSFACPLRIVPWCVELLRVAPRVDIVALWTIAVFAVLSLASEFAHTISRWIAEVVVLCRPPTWVIEPAIPMRIAMEYGEEGLLYLSRIGRRESVEGLGALGGGGGGGGRRCLCVGLGAGSLGRGSRGAVARCV
jgi:hypothetical protein